VEIIRSSSIIRWCYFQNTFNDLPCIYVPNFSTDGAINLSPINASIRSTKTLRRRQPNHGVRSTFLTHTKCDLTNLSSRHDKINESYRSYSIPFDRRSEENPIQAFRFIFLNNYSYDKRWPSSVFIKFSIYTYKIIRKKKRCLLPRNLLLRLLFLCRLVFFNCSAIVINLKMLLYVVSDYSTWTPVCRFNKGFHQLVIHRAFVVCWVIFTYIGSGGSYFTFSFQLPLDPRVYADFLYLIWGFAIFHKILISQIIFIMKFILWKNLFKTI